MDHEEIAKKAAEAIMQRANDTYPRTLHKDMLVDEISKAIKEATKNSDWANWPPKVPGYDPVPYEIVVDAKVRARSAELQERAAEIAKRFGVHQSHISRIQSGDREY